MLSWFHLDRLMFNLEFLTKTGNTVNVPVYNVRIFFSIWHLFNLRKNEWRLCKSVYVLFYVSNDLADVNSFYSSFANAGQKLSSDFHKFKKPCLLSG